MSDEACPYCGAEYDFAEYWRERDESNLFSIRCDECGEIFVVDVTIELEFRAVRVKCDDEEQST